MIHVNAPVAPSLPRRASRGREGRRRRCVPLLKQLLADCYRLALEEAFRLGAESIAFPCLGTGTRGWPSGEAARIGVSVGRGWLRHRVYGERRRGVVRRVVFLCEERGRIEAAWRQALNEFWPESEGSKRSFGEYVERLETRRLGRDMDRLVEREGIVMVAPAEESWSPVVGTQVTIRTRELRRSGRVRKRPERYGQ